MNLSAMLTIFVVSIFKNIPVFILTTSSSEQDKNYCIGLGCEQFLIKPVTLSGYEKIADLVLHFMQTKVQ